MTDRHVRFTLGDESQVPYALQLRLTPQMVAAIRSSSAAAAGAGPSQQQQQQPSIQLDPTSKKASVSFNGEEFQFKTLPDQGCSVIKIDKEQGIATAVGSLAQKMQPVRTVAGTAASLAATAAEAAEAAGKLEKAKEGLAPQPSSALPPAPPLPILSPLDSHKGLPPAYTIEGPTRFSVLQDALALGAARRGSLRLVLISLLVNRPVSLRTIKTNLYELQQWVPGFKYPQGKGDLEQAVKKIAEYKPPGRYILNSGLESEIEPLLAEAEAIQKSAAAKKTNRHAEMGLESKLEKQKQKLSSPMMKNNKKLKRPRTTSPTPLHGDQEDTVHDANEEIVFNAASLSPAARRKVTPSLRSFSPSNHSRDDDNDDDGGTITATAASRPLSSSSRGSGGVDESWVLEHAHRLPEPAPLLTTAVDYHTANAEFQRRYLIYFKLHQLLSGNRRDFEALQAAVDDAPSVEEKERIEGEVERLWTRRARRSRKWEAAFKVLHDELAEWKIALSAYASALNSSNDDTSSGEEEDEEEI